MLNLFFKLLTAKLVLLTRVSCEFAAVVIKFQFTENSSVGILFNICISSNFILKFIIFVLTFKNRSSLVRTTINTKFKKKKLV